jgi:hypothetical protein
MQLLKRRRKLGVEFSVPPPVSSRRFLSLKSVQAFCPDKRVHVAPIGRGLFPQKFEFRHREQNEFAFSALRFLFGRFWFHYLSSPLLRASDVAHSV